MIRPSHRLASLSLSCTSILALAACGDDGQAGPDTNPETSATLPGTSGGTTDATATADPPTTGDPSTVSGTQGDTDGQTSTPTTGTTATTTDAVTTSGVCSDDELCAGECCGADELCDNGECVPDCGGPPPCGAAKECCAAGDLCYLGECVTPGDACSEQVCATHPDPSACGDGLLCDKGLGLCLPDKGDASCEFVPPLQEFKPTPLFTWGVRQKFACAKDSDCQTAELCTDKVCTPTWSHVVPANDDKPNHVQASSIPLVVDLDDDCVPEIVFNSYMDTGSEADYVSNGVLRAIRGDTGAKVWTVTDPAYETNSTANPAIGDIDGDGSPEIIVQGEGKLLLAFGSDGAPKWKSENYLFQDNSSSPAIANMDGAGDPELVVGSAVFDNKGKKLFEGAGGIGINNQGPISCVADLDGDMRPEIIAGRTAYRTTGTVAGKNFAGQVMWNAADPGDGFCGIADFNEDGKPEVVLVAGKTLHVLNGQTGQALASLVLPSGFYAGPPNIADFTGDGVRDIGVAGSIKYIVLEFDGAALSTLWTAATDDSSSQVTGSSVFDFDGDGRYEVVYNDEQYIRIYPGTEPDCAMNPPGPGCNGVMTDAEVLLKDLNSSRTRTEYPVIADVDGDFKANIVFSANNDVPALQIPPVDAGIEVWKDSLDNWVGTRPIWNQHTYHITNTGLRGEIPAVEPDNWTTPANNPYNSYRNNVQGKSPYCAPDLVPYDLDFVADTCDAKLELSVYVANQGCLGVGPGVKVAFYDEQSGFLGIAPTLGPLPAGASEKVSLAFPGVTGMHTVYAVIDDNGMGGDFLNECVEDNNATPPTPVCIPPG